jgi:modification methylase
MAVFPYIPDNVLDLVITSPPYNLGKTHHTEEYRHSPYSDNMIESEYQEQQIAVLDQCYRCLKHGGSLFYAHKNRIKNGETITPYWWLLETRFVIKQEIVWINGSHNLDKVRFYPMTERVYWLSKGRDTQFHNNINHCDFFKGGEWPPVGVKVSKTRAFPLQMVMDILACFPEDSLVLDLYMGSGTVALGAVKTNNRYIGIEISQEYCDMAVERLAQDAKQMTLF